MSPQASGGKGAAVYAPEPISKEHMEVERGPFRGRKGGIVFCKACKHAMCLVSDAENIWWECGRSCCGRGCATASGYHPLYDREVMRGLRELLREIQGGRCYLCAERMNFDGVKNKKVSGLMPTIDHVWAQCLGGHTTLDNLLLACASCNSEKSMVEHARAIGLGLVPPQKHKMLIA